LRIGGTVTFKLKTELELTEEEQALVKKYSFSNAVLFSSDVYEDLQRAFRPALFLGIVAFILAALLLPQGRDGINGIILKVMVVPTLGILTVLIMTVAYFFEMRKSITIGQLLNGGRTFYCHSVVELDEQEAELLDMSRRIHATLEKARDWGGREINPIPIGNPFYLPDEDYSHSQSKIEMGMQAAGASLGKMFKPQNTGTESKPKVREPATTPTPRPAAPFSNATASPPKTSTPPSPPKPTSSNLPPSSPSPPAQAQQPPKASEPPNSPEQPKPHPFAPKPPEPPSEGS